MKILYLGLVFLLLCSFLVIGCNSASTTTVSTTTTSTVTSTTTSPVVSTSSTTTVSVSKPANSGPQYGGTYKVACDRPPAGSLGWFAEPGPPSGTWYFTMFEGLCRTQYSGAIEPLLASDWKLADDLKSITLHLQKNVKFHDGSDFNAEVAKWNIDQFIAAKMSGVKDFSSVDIVDPYTIKINLKNYYNTLMYSLNSVPMVSKVAFETKGGKEYLRKNPIGTGPFTFVSYSPDISIKVKKNPNYWQSGKPYVDTIEVLFIADPMTASSAYEAGEVDAFTGNSPKILHDLQQKMKSNLITEFTGALTMIPDSKNADSPLADIKVRMAIDYAIDRESLVKAKGYGMWATTYQFAASNSSAYIKDLKGRVYNPEKAKQLLAEAGYPNGLKITLIGDGSSTDKDSTVALQGFLSKVGIQTELVWVDYAGFVQYVMGGWNNGMLVCNNGFAPNMNSAVNFVWSQQAMFFPSVLKTDDMEKLITAANVSKDYDPNLVKIYLQKMHDEAMFLPLYSIVRGMAVDTDVHDTGYLQGYGPYTWNPVTVWIGK